MEFRILGPIEVLDQGRMVAIGGAKPRALLGALLVRAGDVVSAERLIDELWGDRPPPTAAAALQVHVSALRKALGSELVAWRGRGYVAVLDGHELDLQRFDDLVEEARTAPPGVAAGLLRTALGLWRGEPEVDAVRLSELRRAAIEARIDADLELGRAADVIAELHALVEEEPLREHTRAQLVLALYRAGRQADALAELARARTLLMDELGIEPGPELRGLQRAILGHDQSLGAPGPAAPASRPSLPAAPSPLIGRKQELATLAELLAGGARLVTLTGPGGIGKTRLALEGVQRAEPHAAFVSLAAIEDASLVPVEVARALGLDAFTGSPEEAVARRLQAEPTLLLLDNFEQVLEAASFVSAWLAAAPSTRIVVTSRSLLRIAGERELAVPPLEAAVELFVDRSSGTIDDLTAVRAICERLDNIPLAVELAAARTSLLPLPALLERLEPRLALLTGGPRDAPERQQTMRNAIDWSYRLLEPPEQRLFARLAVFHGGATLAAVEAVCGDGVLVLDVLASLVEKSLVRRRDGSGEPRFGMLETVREYAADELVSLGEDDGLRDRHAEWCVELAAGANQGLESAHQDEWLERLELELPNLRAALERTLARGNASAAVVLAGDPRRFWQVHGHLDEGRRWLERALALDDIPAGLAARGWTGLGIVLGEQGDYDGAGVAFERSLELARQIDDPLRVASALNNLGSVALYQGNPARAEELYDAAHELTRDRPGAEHHSALSLENIGCTRMVLGDLDGAVDALRGALELTRALGELRAVASSEWWLAAALIARGELPEAAVLLGSSLPLARRIGFRQGVAAAITVVAAYETEAGRPAIGAQLLAAAGVRWEALAAARPPDLSVVVTRTEGALRATLGAAAFDRESAAGRLLDEGEAVALAEQALAS